MSERQHTRNRRLSMRRLTKRKVRVACRKGTLDLGHNLADKVIDVSETGIRLVLRVALEVDQEVTVAMEGIGHRRPIMRLGKVVWCRPDGQDTYQVGIHFEKSLPYRDVLELS